MNFKLIFNSTLLTLLFISTISLGLWIKYLEPISTPKTLETRKETIIKRAWQSLPAPGVCFEVEENEIRSNYELSKMECKSW